MYSEKVMKLFKEPKNMGKLEDFDAKGRAGNPQCGDVMEIFIKVEKNKEDKDVIDSISFQSFGCVASISTSSMITELAEGKTLGEAEEITNEQVAEELGGLPKIKMHCSNLAADALHEAIYNYKKKNNLEISEELERAHEKAKKSLEMTEHIREEIE